MEAEYFPPNEVVILQNEIPTNLYILVTGAVDIIAQKDGDEQIIGKVVSGEMFGETGVLYNTPQPFTFQTREISQILRMDGSALLQTIHTNTQDGFIIMNNFYKKLKGLERFGHEGLSMENSTTDVHNYRDENQVTWETSDIDYSNSSDIKMQEQINNSISNKNDMNVNIPAEEGRSALHVAVNNGHLEMVRLLLEGGANVNKPDIKGCTPKSLAKQQENKSVYDLLLSHEKKRNEHKIEFIEHETTDSRQTNRYLPTTNKNPCCSTSFTASASNSPIRHPGGKVNKQMKRVTIHANLQNTPEKHIPKLIVLPDSLDELLNIAGQKYGGQHFAKVVNSESAEVDDLNVIKDEDHLFFLPNDCQCRDYNVT
ncbi:hypothetical protein QVD17_18052 [Tagetes erecta]|uniref:Potassium channel n=1 Tax=Tagetes erecta TaxID=13708 RepID=A0AAD8KJX9_TARER|nr:hypothetical protein QVD17_18052 [Tagetes erecta]